MLPGVVWVLVHTISLLNLKIAFHLITKLSSTWFLNLVIPNLDIMCVKSKRLDNDLPVQNIIYIHSLHLMYSTTQENMYHNSLLHVCLHVCLPSVTVLIPARWLLWAFHSLDVMSDHQAGIKTVTQRECFAALPGMHMDISEASRFVHIAMFFRTPVDQCSANNFSTPPEILNCLWYAAIFHDYGVAKVSISNLGIRYLSLSYQPICTQKENIVRFKKLCIIGIACRRLHKDYLCLAVTMFVCFGTPHEYDEVLL